MAKTKEPERTVIQATSIDQLGTVNFQAEIEMLDGSVLSIPMATMKYEAFWTQGEKVPDPKPPQLAGAKGLMYDLENPDYKKAITDANHKRDYYRLLPCIRLPIPGETEAEQVAYLMDKLDYGIALQLMALVTRSMFAREARIDAKAASFRRPQQGNGADTGAAGQDET